MLKQMKHIAVVGVSTVGSRILGLARDILLFAALGAGLWNSAFLLAFTLPNLFRRLFGEGALTSALVPVFSGVMEREGRSSAFSFFNQVFLRLFLVLFLLVAAGMLALVFAGRWGNLSREWAAGAELSVTLLPYMLLVCLAAGISAGLNLLGRFAVAALTPVLLNLSMIGSLLFGMWWTDDPKQIVYCLCAGVLFGGLLQFLAPAWDFMRQGWRPRLDTGSREELGELWGLFVPGLMGAGILQLNILVSRLLAYSLDEAAVSLLYLASRLMELPLGIFTISVATVYFPLMARALAGRDDLGFGRALGQGMRLVAAIAVPAGIGLALLAPQILEILFRRGAFEAADVAATAPLVAIYGLSLPFYSAATFAMRGLHAGKNMRTPVRVAGLCLLVNGVSGFILMQFFGAAGLAAGNGLAAVLQAALLWRALAREHRVAGFYQLRRPFAKILLAGLGMGLVCFGGRALVTGFGLSDKLAASVTLVALVPGCAALYFGLLYLLRFEEMDGLRRFLQRFVAAGRSA
ncbi:MAG: murein biosynthesis integral membrane protein MurJ [Opitutales bacterium]